MKRFEQFALNALVAAVLAGGLCALPAMTVASGFQLWEQDAASIGNFHAGYAAEANDASTSWYNPAGIMRLKNQQVVAALNRVSTDFTYRGDITVNQLFGTYHAANIKANGGTTNLVPALHYVAPINDQFGFGFSVTVPFGLKTDYGIKTPLRLATTRTAITVVDISPAFAFRANNQWSFGAGLDIQRASAELNSAAALVLEGQLLQPTMSTNKAHDTGYGYHVGALYEVTPSTRFGISYHSAVDHKLKGKSKFVGDLAKMANNGQDIVSYDAQTKIKLPAYTAASVYHDVTPDWALLGSVVYTGWHTIKNLTLENVASIQLGSPFPFPPVPAKISIVLPEHFRDTINVSVGTNYKLTDKFMVRGGLSYDPTPVRNHYRTVQLPDNDRYIVAAGAHYQASRTIGFDVGFAHVMMSKVRINPPIRTVGVETIGLNGHSTGGANVYSAQITWDIV